MALTPITDAEMEVLLADGAPIGDRLRQRVVTFVQARRVLDVFDQRPPPVEAVLIGRIDRPDDAAGPFFDPHDATHPPPILFERVLEHGDETFRLHGRIGYWDQDLGGLIVPADPQTFRTDLTSVPVFFTWLVPQTGRHLPAALVHDGLVLDKDRVRTYIGPEVDRVTADRIFRDGMRDLDTSLIRRWVIWTAVAIATAWSQPSFVRRWWWRVVIAVSVAIVVALGGLATIDLFDCRDALPWMGDRPLWQELLFGAGMAIAVPLVLALVLWHGQRAAGAIAGIALAFVLHVTLALVVLLSLYSLAENIRRPKFKEISVALLGLLLAGAVPIAFVWWACQ